MKDILITTDYKNSLDDIVGRVQFADTPAGNFAYEMFMYDPKIYRLEPVIESDPETGKMMLTGMTLVSTFSKSDISEGTVGKSGKTD